MVIEENDYIREEWEKKLKKNNVVLCAAYSGSIALAWKYIKKPEMIKGFCLQSVFENEVYDILDELQDVLAETEIGTGQIKGILKELLHCVELNVLTAETLEKLPDSIDGWSLSLGSGMSFSESEMVIFTEKLKTCYDEILTKSRVFASDGLRRIHLNEIETPGDCVVILDDSIWNLEIALTMKEFKRFFWWDDEPMRYYGIYQYQHLPDKSALECIILGMSYMREGINTKRFCKPALNFSSTAQDIFYDFEMCKYVCADAGNIKYCILGISPYELWYDMSKSPAARKRISYYFPQISDYHHWVEGETQLERFQYLNQIFTDIFDGTYMDEIYFWELNQDEEIWKEKCQIYCKDEKKDIDDVNRVFHKPYPATFEENVEILRQMKVFLDERGIRLILVIPPYSQTFMNNMDMSMYRKTVSVLNSLLGKNDRMYDFIGDDRFDDNYFQDCSHLNYFGKNLMTDILNGVVDSFDGRNGFA